MDSQTERIASKTLMENVGQTCKIKDFSQTKQLHLGGRGRSNSHLFRLKIIFIT